MSEKSLGPASKYSLKLTLVKEIWANSHFRQDMENLLTGMLQTMATQVSKCVSPVHWSNSDFIPKKFGPPTPRVGGDIDKKCMKARLKIQFIAQGDPKI